MLVEQKATDRVVCFMLDGIVCCMPTATKPRMLSDCEENVTQLHAILDHEDQ